MSDRVEKKRLAILRLLKERNEPLSSKTITELLSKIGYDISERTIRFHLNSMDKDGLTEYIEKKGRKITNQGVIELSNARVFEKVGYFSAKIDQMIYRMSFNLSNLEGTVIVNVSLIKEDIILDVYPLIERVFKAGYAMGRLLTIIKPSDRIGDIIIPEGYIGIGTLCSINLNGIFLEKGIPMNSRFGGVLEIIDGKCSRFVGIINYNGTSIDPLEIFIKSGMTDYLGATNNGNGQIGVGFREVPAESRDMVIELSKKLEDIGLGDILEIGWPGQPLFGIPVNEGSVGIVVIGGLNPIAILEESGYNINSRALSGLVEYKNLFPYTELAKRIRNLK